MTLDELIKKYKPHEVDFVFPSADDTHAYLDLYFLYKSPDVRWHKVHALIFEYFNRHLNLYRGKKISGEKLLEKLHFPEVPYIGLGHCKEGVRGFGTGDSRAEVIKDSIFDNEEVQKVGLLALAQTSITIGGWGPDLLSDMVANFGMHYFLEYTDEQVKLYGLKTAEFQIQRALDTQTYEWSPLLKVKLPFFEESGEPRILVPKHIVKKLPVFTTQGYYDYYLKYLLQAERGDQIKNIKTLASVPKVSIKQIEDELKKKYEVLGEATRTLGLKRPKDIETYVKDPLVYKKHHTKKKKENIDWKKYSKELFSIPAGKKHAYIYADTIRKIFTALYGESLVNGVLEERSVDGMYHYDISFANAAETIFFKMLRNQQIVAGTVIIEAKNYDKKKLANQEFNQAAGYTIQDGRELVIIVTRKPITKKHIEKAKRHFLTHHKTLLLPISDEDINKLLEKREGDPVNFDNLLAIRAQEILCA